MKEKIRHGICRVVDSVIMAGIVIFLIGMYYFMIKAGIPYQDPTLEMSIQYAVDMRIGEVLLKNGFVMVVCGGVTRLLFRLLWKRR